MSGRAIALRYLLCSTAIALALDGLWIFATHPERIDVLTYVFDAVSVWGWLAYFGSRK